MSKINKQLQNTPNTLLQLKNKQEKIVVLTCYDYSTAKCIDESGDIDCILVGDSLGMVMLGYADTTQVTMADMLHHTKAVKRGVKHALLVADMPYGSVTISQANALQNIQRLIAEGGAQAVKIEGASAYLCEVIRHATEHGIPVMGHLGFTPQSVQALGGYKVQGKTIEQAQKLLVDALALQQAGAFAIVLEMVPSEVASWISELLTIPTIGIGAGVGCDGQVLVIDDMLGRYADFQPKFSRRFAQLNTQITEAVSHYAKAVKESTFPNVSESFSFPEKESEALAKLKQAYLGQQSKKEKVLI